MTLQVKERIKTITEQLRNSEKNTCSVTYEAFEVIEGCNFITTKFECFEVLVTANVDEFGTFEEIVSKFNLQVRWVNN